MRIVKGQDMGRKVSEVLAYVYTNAVAEGNWTAGNRVQDLIYTAQAMEDNYQETEDHKEVIESLRDQVEEFNSLAVEWKEEAEETRIAWEAEVAALKAEIKELKGASDE